MLENDFVKKVEASRMFTTFHFNVAVVSVNHSEFSVILWGVQSHVSFIQLN